MSKEQLVKYSKEPNIAKLLSEEKLMKIGDRVKQGYEEDYGSMSEWLGKVEEAMKLSKLTKEPKNTPRPNSANIKFPLITTACFQFAARTYPELVKDGIVVKAKVVGKDTDGSKTLRADRVSRFMSYQLLDDSSDWEAGMDKLLTLLPNIGFVCKKTYYDSIKKMNCSEVCNYKDIVINSNSTSLKDAQRITHILHYHLNDLVEHARAKLFLDEPVKELVDRFEELEIIENDAFDCYEQHRNLDLDEDGYAEPYVVTSLKENNKVLRIVARYREEDIETDEKGKITKINPIQYFTDYHFLPSPDGKFQSMGFGTLMLHLNESVNTILNQLIDAGSFRNMQGGFIDARFKVQATKDEGFEQGEWRRLKGGTALQSIKDGIIPLEYHEPSSVLFQLLGLLIQTGRELSSSTEALQGTQQAEYVKTGALQSLMDQGLKVFSSIQKRLYRSQKDEYKKLFMLNKYYLDPYIEQNVLDDKLAISQNDFNDKDVDVIPVADPNISSDAQVVGRIQFLMSLLETSREVDRREILMRALEFAKIPSPEKILPPPDPNAPPPPEILKLQADMHAKADELKIKGEELELKKKDQILKALELEAKIIELKTKSILNIANAEAAEAGTQLQDYQMSLDSMQSKLDNIMEHKQMDHEKEMQDKDIAMRQQEVANAKSASEPVA